MSRWWRKVQESLPTPSSLQKTARKNLSLIENKYRDLNFGADLRKTLNRSASDYGKQARELAEDASSRVGKRVAESARALPSKAAKAAKDAAKGVAVAGYTATANAASAGAQSARDAGKRTKDKVFSYAAWTGWRITLLLFGTAFLYGVGSALPGAVARYYTEKERRRDDGEQTTEGGNSFPSSSSKGAEENGIAAEIVDESSSSLRGKVKRWLTRQ